MQPVSGYQWKVISGGVGTAVITDISTEVKRLIIPGTYVGTLKLHDAAATDGTTATSAFLTLGLPASSLFQSIELNLQCKKGLVYEATGTPLATILWK